MKYKQLLLNFTDRATKIILKSCYFLFMILLLACGSDSTKKAPITQKESTTIKANSDKDTTSKTILFFGDSLTAGYGLDDVNEAFPALIQKTIDSLSLNYTVINSGVSGETTAGGRSRIDWVLNQKVDVFILELGANDGLRGVPLKETSTNLQAIIDAVHNKYPAAKIVLVGMQIPPNMGIDYTSEFKQIFPRLAKTNKISLIPFLLKDVGGIPALNQGDGIHPTAKGHKILARNVWEVLGPIVR